MNDNNYPDMPLEIRLTVDNMKTTVIHQLSGMFQAWGDENKLKKMVDSAVEKFDFESEIRRMVNDCIRHELNQKLGWLAEDKVKGSEMVRRIDKLQKKLSSEVRIELGLDY